MKLSIETFALREKLGDEGAMELIARAGFDCVDYSFYWQAEGSPALGEEYQAYARKIRAVMEKNGLRCNQAHAPFWADYQEKTELGNPHYRQLVRAVEAASILGAEQIVVHALMVPPEETKLDAEEINLAYYRSLEPYCRKFGIRVAVENLFRWDEKRRTHHGVLASGKALSAFIQKLDSPWFVACIDVGHAAITGSEPEDFIRAMAPGLLQGLHIQDSDYLGDRHTLPYSGWLNWEKIMAALKETGYTGELTFEVFGYLRRLPKALLPDALRYAARIGRYLIDLFEA